MIRHFLFFVLCCIFSASIYAQKGANAFSINGEATVLFFQNDRGFGFYLKGAHGFGKAEQVTLSFGISTFKSKNSVETDKVNTRVIPFLLGFKHNMQHVYIEPKIGIGELGGRISLNGDYARPSVTALFGGLEAGYQAKRVHAGIHFMTAHGIQDASAGLWHNENFHYTSVFVGCQLFQKKP